MMLSSENLRAQPAADGCAGAYVLASRGADASIANPALLAAKGGVRVRVLSFESFAANDSYTAADYRRWNGATWDAGDKEEILAKLDDDGLEARAGAHVYGPAFAFRDWSLAVRTEAQTRVELPRALAEIALLGNPPGEPRIIDDFDFDATTWTEVILSRAYLREAEGGAWCYGASAKYLRGHAFAEILRGEGKLVTDLDGVTGEGTFLARTAVGGDGFGMDLGVARLGYHDYDLGIALRNLASGIRWNRQVEEHETYVLAESVTVGNAEDEDLFESTSRSYTSSAFRRSIPSTLLLSAARTFGIVRWEALLEQPLGKDLAGKSTPRVAIGISEPELPWLDLRAGLSIGGFAGAYLAGGLGLHLGPVDLDLALRSAGGLNPASGLGIGGSLGVAWIARGLKAEE